MKALLESLRGGDRRSIAGANAVARRVQRKPRLFATLVDGMEHKDPLLRMRSADAAEKVTRERPDLLVGHEALLLRVASLSEQQEVRWHVAQMLPRLRLTPTDRAMALKILRRNLADGSRIVQVCAMQALADIAHEHKQIRRGVVDRIARVVHSGSPAVRARGRRLLKELRAAWACRRR